MIVALHDEAELIPLLVERLDRIRYPRELLRGFIVVEPFDHATRHALNEVELPDWLSVIVAPDTAPVTKPRALNLALEQIEDGLVCVFDAEDAPHPDQLLEAAERFAKEDDRLACLQAPLRIRTRGDRWMERQFAAEYGALFEVLLPAMAEGDFPLPLGGTSNHFRVDVLREVGGWDAWNVTEDADLGFRLARAGYRTGMIARPTSESAPGPIRCWLPQRTRWLKGFMQTWGVHTRSPRLSARVWLAMSLTLGLTLAAALAQGLVLMWFVAVALTSTHQGVGADIPLPYVGLAAAGWLSGAASCWVGARRAGTRYGVVDALTAPAYWSLSSFALVHAVWRLVTEPFYWDKTPHSADGEDPAAPVRDLQARATVAT